MNEIIKSIKEVSDIKINGHYANFGGYEIETDKQVIKVLISQDQHCCEDFGYLSSVDDPEDFIGAIINKVELVDEFYDKTEWKRKFNYGLDDGEAMFVNFETDKGTFQLTAYNRHNGFYSHAAFLISKDLNVTESL